MGIRARGADGGFPAADRGGLAGMGEGAFPDPGSSGIGAAGNTGATAFCRVSSATGKSRHPQRDGPKRLFAGAVFFTSAGAIYSRRQTDTGGGRYSTI